MNDRFEFRVWCKNKNEWEKDDVLIGVNVNSWIIKTISSYTSLFTKKPVDPENHIIEQCTGLKDKNGKLIYEGDIVKYKQCYNENTKTEKIDFVKYTKGEYLPREYYRHQAGFPDWQEDFEIIGNIHENKDLLK